MRKAPHTAGLSNEMGFSSETNQSSRTGGCDALVKLEAASIRPEKVSADDGHAVRD